MNDNDSPNNRPRKKFTSAVICPAVLDKHLDALLELERLRLEEEGRLHRWNPEQSKRSFVEDDVVLVAQHADTVAGFCRMRMDSNASTGIIYQLFVSPEYRRQGIGASLMESACDAIRRHSCRYAYLGVEAENEAAIALYKKVGFQPTRINMAREL